MSDRNIFKKILAGVGIAAAVGLVLVLKPLATRPEEIEEPQPDETGEEDEEMDQGV